MSVYQPVQVSWVTIEECSESCGIIIVAVGKTSTDNKWVYRGLTASVSLWKTCILAVEDLHSSCGIRALNLALLIIIIDF